MKNWAVRFAVLAACAVPFLASSANATLLVWSYTGTGISGSGTMDATCVGDVCTINSISGTANGMTIVGLDTYDGPDNLVFPPAPPLFGVDSLGFSFSVGAAGSYNLYEDLYDSSSPYYCGGAVNCLLGPGTMGAGDPVAALTSFTVNVVPEPSTWAMLLLGFAGLGFLGYRETAKARVAA